ncbi:hypothetical protein D3C86_1379520 [compost metagenome]
MAHFAVEIDMHLLHLKVDRLRALVEFLLHARTHDDAFRAKLAFVELRERLQIATIDLNNQVAEILGGKVAQARACIFNIARSAGELGGKVHIHDVELFHLLRNLAVVALSLWHLLDQNVADHAALHVLGQC